MPPSFGVPVVSSVLLLASGQLLAQSPPRIDLDALRTAFTDLREPASLQVRNPIYKAQAGAWVMCAEFNAKNAYGGYAGFQRFMAIVGPDRSGKKTAYQVVATGSVAVQMCAADGM